VLFPDEAAAKWAAGWADVATLMNVLEHVNAPFATDWPTGAHIKTRWPAAD